MKYIRYSNSIFKLALVIIFGIWSYLYFVPSVSLNPIEFKLSDDINNYPQPKHSSSSKSVEKVFLGDRFVVSLKIRNNSTRYFYFTKLDLKLSFSQQMRINAINGKKYDSYQSVDNLVLQIDNLLPFETRTESIVLTSGISGVLKVKAALTHPTNNERIENDAQLLELQIHSRPVDASPRVPADMASYLSDLVREECNVTPYMCPRHGNCESPPNTPEVEKCLKEGFERVFSGCGEAPLDESTVDEWQLCLMKKHGFMSQ